MQMTEIFKSCLSGTMNNGNFLTYLNKLSTYNLNINFIIITTTCIITIHYIDLSDGTKK